MDYGPSIDQRTILHVDRFNQKLFLNSWEIKSKCRVTNNIYGPSINLSTVDGSCWLICRTELFSSFLYFLLSIEFWVCRYNELRLTTTLHVMMAPKKEVFYPKRGETKSVALSHRMIEEDYDNEQDQAYVPPGSSTPTAPACVHRGTLGRWLLI